VTGPVPWPITNDGHPLKDNFPIPMTLYNVALQWLKDDREFRRRLENQGRKLRGARRNEVRYLLDCVCIHLYDYHISARAIRFRDILQEVCFVFLLILVSH
jgi:hypothetical protein